MLGITKLRKTQPKTKNPVWELEVTNWFGRWMWNRRWGGFTLPLPFFTLIFYWLLPGDHVNPLVRVHEFVHVAQSERYSFAFLTWEHYAVESLTDAFNGRGFYSDNKYEQEAYEVETWAEEHGLPSWAQRQS